jgi:hypothetical protein
MYVQRCCTQKHCARITCVPTRCGVQGKKVDNSAVLQLQVTKGENQFLSTLAEPGLAQFLTFLKPCAILLPHVHQRANEFYSVISGAPLLRCAWSMSDRPARSLRCCPANDSGGAPSS